jgi:hypothetical protein
MPLSLSPEFATAIPAYVPEVEDADDDDFEVIIDEPLLCVVRCNGRVAAQVHSPLDLIDLSYRLAEHGFMATEMMAYEDGVLELLLRELTAQTPFDADLPEQEKKLMTDVASYMKEREGAYA